MGSRASTKRLSRDERLDRVFGALADPTRRALLKRLGKGPRAVSDLAEPFAMSLPAVSKHLRVLEIAGLVTRSVEGRVHNCKLEVDALREAERWLEHHRSFWAQSLESLARYAEEDEG